jgi:hypothetical protein
MDNVLLNSTNELEGFNFEEISYNLIGFCGISCFFIEVKNLKLGVPMCLVVIFSTN